MVNSTSGDVTGDDVGWRAVAHFTSQHSNQLSLLLIGPALRIICKPPITSRCSLGLLFTTCSPLFTNYPADLLFPPSSSLPFLLDIYSILDYSISAMESQNNTIFFSFSTMTSCLQMAYIVLRPSVTVGLFPWLLTIRENTFLPIDQSVGSCWFCRPIVVYCCNLKDLYF